MDYILREDENGMVIDGKIEGAPHIRERTLPVFDTANRCGTGKRYIHYLGSRPYGRGHPRRSYQAPSLKPSTFPERRHGRRFRKASFSTSWKLGDQGYYTFTATALIRASRSTFEAGVAETTGERRLKILSYHDLFELTLETPGTNLHECKKRTWNAPTYIRAV